MRPPSSKLRTAPALILILAGAVTQPGCSDVLNGGVSAADGDRDALRIATSWPRSERSRLARAFAEWLKTPGHAEAVDAVAIAWLESPDDRPVGREADRPGPAPDVLLGGPVADYAQLASRERLEPLGDLAARPYWVVARRSAVGPTGGDGASSPLATADPRIDPATRAWCLGVLEKDAWRPAYSRLLDDYGRSQIATGWRADSARAAVARGGAGSAVAVLDAPSPDSGTYEEGAGIVRGARRAKSARSFLKFLMETQDAQAGPEFEGAASAAVPAERESLVADLLGATLVDAQEELREAVAAVRGAGSPAWAVERLTQPPPWPPASIEKLLRKEGEAGLALVETLIGQVAPEPGPRLWLAQDWLRPRRDLDLTVLSEIAGVERGRLAREPRFRAWLRAEWTQWARQRYRWVARLAASGEPKADPPPVPSES